MDSHKDDQDLPDVGRRSSTVSAIGFNMIIEPTYRPVGKTLPLQQVQRLSFSLAAKKKRVVLAVGSRIGSARSDCAVFATRYTIVIICGIRYK